MQEIKRLGVISVARITALFGIFMGLIFGILIAALGTVSDGLATAGVPAIVGGWQAIIVLPIFYGILYFLSGLVGAAIYNLLAGWVGGVKVELTGSTGKKK